MKIDKSVDGVFGTQTRAAGWKAQANPLSYGGCPRVKNVCPMMHAHANIKFDSRNLFIIYLPIWQ